MSKYLNLDGLGTFWTKIKNTFVKKNDNGYIANNQIPVKSYRASGARAYVRICRCKAPTSSISPTIDCNIRMGDATVRVIIQGYNGWRANVIGYLNSTSFKFYAHQVVVEEETFYDIIAYHTTYCRGFYSAQFLYDYDVMDFSYWAAPYTEYTPTSEEEIPYIMLAKSTASSDNAPVKVDEYGNLSAVKVDNSPTAGHTANLVSSDGIKTALDGKSSTSHTHTTSIASDSSSGTVVSLAHNTQYKLTAGGTSVLFKTPADNNTDTKVKATAKTDNVAYKILATASPSPTSGNATEAVYDTDISLNPSTNTITSNISGKAATATKPAVTTLSSTDDLNSVRGSSVGDVLWYKWQSGSPPSNAPSSDTSVMEVVRTHSDSYITQTVYTTSHSVYRRECLNGTWGDWYSYSKSTHTHGNIANGGTLTDTAAAAAGNDYVVIRDADNSKIQTSTIKGTDVADAVSKKHSHSTITLSTTAQKYDGSHTLALPSTDPYTSARTPASHTHGNIQNGGTLQTTDITIASGDKLVVTDSSNSSKIARASLSFDGSTTTTALTPKGTFEPFAKAGDIPPAVSVKGDAESSYRTGQVNLTPANLGISATTTSVTVGSTTCNNTDTKVTQTKDDSGTTEYPLLMAGATNPNGSATTARYDSNVKLKPSTNTISANISGNAATATSATNVNLVGDVKTPSTTNGDTIRVKAGSGTAAEITIINAKHAASADSATSATSATTATNSTKSAVTADTGSKLYIIGSTGSSGQQALKTDTGIYATTNSGELHATKFDVNGGCTLQYNSTTKSLDFVFA